MNAELGFARAADTAFVWCRKRTGRKMWGSKLFVCILVDLFDFTIGRFLFPIPFCGEIIGCAACVPLFGWRGVFYALEAFDPTEQLDGFIPAATIIAFANRPDA